MLRRTKDQRLVIVEDDPFIRDSLVGYFSPHNQVLAFSNAEDAIAAQPKFAKVTVFIIDFILPGKDGVELFQLLRLRFSSARYIMITGEMSYEMAEETRKLGLDALILKPFDFSILEDNISALVGV